MSNFLKTNVKTPPSFQGIPFNKPVEENKKTNTIKKSEQNPDFKKNTRFDWYFRMGSSKIYNLVVQGDRYSNRYVVLTGYTMSESVAKKRQHDMFGASNYEAWVKNLPSL